MGRVHALLFGGQFDGNIVLMHSTEGIITMSHPSSLHNCRITNIVGSNDLITACTTPALVTFASVEQTLNIWSMNIVEKNSTVFLTPHLCIYMMNNIPRRFLLTNMTLCLALKDKQLIMFNLPDKQQNRYTYQYLELSKLPMMKHQHDDDHRNSITSLVFCSYLQIIITSSSDGIKSWNLENQLISDLDVGVPVSSVGFANDSGDLLIGARKIITVLRAEDYLPPEYVAIAKKCPKLDLMETPIPFNPELEFW